MAPDSQKHRKSAEWSSCRE